MQDYNSTYGGALLLLAPYFQRPRRRRTRPTAGWQADRPVPRGTTHRLNWNSISFDYGYDCVLIFCLRHYFRGGLIQVIRPGVATAPDHLRVAGL